MSLAFVRDHTEETVRSGWHNVVQSTCISVKRYRLVRVILGLEY